MEYLDEAVSIEEKPMTYLFIRCKGESYKTPTLSREGSKLAMMRRKPQNKHSVLLHDGKQHYG